MSRTRKRKPSTPKVGGHVDFSDILDRIKPVQELPLVVTQVTYGRSGTGKTTYASSWPKPMLLLDVKDEGTDSIKDVEGIEVFSIETWEDFEKAYWLLKSGEHKFKSVAIDTVTQLQDKAVNQVLADENKSFVSQQMWGQISGMLKSWLMDYRDLADDGINVHFIFQDRVHDTDTDDEEEGQIDPVVGPQVIPSIAGMITAAVKVIGNTYISESVERTRDGIAREQEYRMRIGPHPYYTTKVRKPKDSPCPSHLANPTYKDIIAIMKGEYEDKTKKKSSASGKGNAARRPRRRRTK